MCISMIFRTIQAKSQHLSLSFLVITALLFGMKAAVADSWNGFDVQDALIPTTAINHAASIFKAAKHPKSFVSIDGADHMLSNRADTEFVADVLGTWSYVIQLRWRMIPVAHRVMLK